MMKTKKVISTTARIKTIEYAIRDVVAIAKELEEEGKKITYLSIGDPPKYDFDTPQHIKDALKKAVDEGENLYMDSLGLPELREAIAERSLANRISVTKEDILITSGVSEGIAFLLAALIEKKDELLLPGPSYPPWLSYTKFYDGVQLNINWMKRMIGSRTLMIFAKKLPSEREEF